MKTPTYILLLLLFVLPLLSNAQNDSIVLNKETPSYKNQIDLDVEFFGAAINYQRGLFTNFSFSFSIGSGFILQNTYLDYDYSKSYSLTEVFRTRTSLNYSIPEKVQFELGLRYSIVSISNNGTSNIIEPNLGLFVNIGKCMIGIRLGFLGQTFGGNNFDRFNTISFAIFRIPILKK